MSGNNLESQFDQWASSYDGDVRDKGTFPFDGYSRVLDRVIDRANIESGMEVLELGPGTGNLTERLAAEGAAVWAVDFSAEMLALAQEKAPTAHFAKAHLLDEYPPDFHRQYARIVSTYTFHELPLADKLSLLRRLVDGYLRADGIIIIGDIGFYDAADRDAVKQRAGDLWEDEHYWLLSVTKAAVRGMNLVLDWQQVSSCGIVLSVWLRL